MLKGSEWIIWKLYKAIRRVKTNIFPRKCFFFWIHCLLFVCGFMRITYSLYLCMYNFYLLIQFTEIYFERSFLFFFFCYSRFFKTTIIDLSSKDQVLIEISFGWIIIYKSKTIIFGRDVIDQHSFCFVIHAFSKQPLLICLPRIRCSLKFPLYE